jgi:hypothetical protein
MRTRRYIQDPGLVWRCRGDDRAGLNHGDFYLIFLSIRARPSSTGLPANRVESKPSRLGYEYLESEVY